MTQEHIESVVKAHFVKDTANHVMEVIRDDGVNRHIRFRAPGTMCMHFDLITWPGSLCYTGDMGTYVFSRLEDMFEFFRSDKGQTHPFTMNPDCQYTKTAAGQSDPKCHGCNRSMQKDQKQES